MEAVFAYDARTQSMPLRGFWCERCGRWERAIGRERAFTFDTYEIYVRGGGHGSD